MARFIEQQQKWSGPRAGDRRGNPADAPTQLFLDFGHGAGSGERRPETPDQEGAATPLRLPALPPAGASPVARLALRLAALLESDPATPLDNVALARLSREYLGAAAGQGRAAYDAAEAGLNLHLARRSPLVSDFKAAVEGLLALQARLPRQTRRDASQIEWQQFSTPPAEALLLVTAAGVRSGMTVLEPSAGTGNIAVLARLAGAAVETNELDPRRRDLLELLGFSPTALDAERLDNLLPAGRAYDAVVMNPPFSATGGRVHGHSTHFGARHVEQALLRLRPGGRLVAIVGRGMAHERPLFQEWWRRIESRYRVRANLGMDGQSFARSGTTFDHQIVVIDHDGPTVRAADRLLGGRHSLEEAYELLKELSQEDIQERVARCAAAPSAGSAADDVRDGAGPAGGPAGGARDAAARRRGGRRRGAARRERNDGTVAHLEPPGERPAASAGDDARAPSPARAGDAADGSSGAPPLGGACAESDARPPGDGVGQLAAIGTPPALCIEAGTVFAAYRVQKALVRGAHAHPANVVESAAMASVEPPDPSYAHHLPLEAVTEGRISDLQLEDLIYAGQATERLLPNGSRKAHWNGDGTGIGKGREVYAFIFDQLQQGRLKHVHISASHQLCADAERDRSAVGLPLAILHQARYAPERQIAAEAGVLFTTYTMLSTDFDGERARFKQLTDWLGPDFQGVLAFDEAHLMKNAAATPHGGKVSLDEGTLRGNMGIALQRLFPLARVRYFSATGATEARHMAPYERLGLWGDGAPFADFAAFLVAMERGGVAAMEMLCRDLKAVGSYLSRTISYGPTRQPDGATVPESAVEYEPLLHRLNAAERRQYDEIADLWAELLIAFETAEANACQRRSGSRYAQFYSVQQRFFLQLMMAYTLPDVIPEIEKDLAAGRSVVVSLFNTGEAQADRKVRDARAHGVELTELDETPREMIVQLIEKQFPIFQYREETDPLTGNVVRVRVTDAAGNPEINRENQRRQQELLERVADLDFPHNPLDALLRHFGAQNVAEISGRTHRWENGRYVRRKLHGVNRRQLNEFETRQFQDGRKRLAVLSGAGATGISVHADVTARNQQRRVFYAFQLSWSADQQMQAFGRVHRSNQVSAPIIRLALLDLAGQRRPVNAVSKRLAALGALTKGERHSLGGALFRPEDVTDQYGKAALARLYREVERNQHAARGLGLPTLERMGVLNSAKTAVRESYSSNVEQFLNRIMVLHVAQQNRFFELFYERYLEAVAAAQRAGAFDFGVEEIHARRLHSVTPTQTLFVDPGSGARTELHELEGEAPVPRRSFEEALTLAPAGFYRNRRSGHVYAVAHYDKTRPGEVLLAGVKGARRALDRVELDQKYESVRPAAAKRWWDAEYARTPAHERRRFHILSGAVFPIYDKIMGAAGLQNVRIARAVLEDGRAIVGLNLNPSDVPRVKERLGIGTPLADAATNDVVGMLAAGARIELDNGWQLVTARIAGDAVVEVVLNGVPANREELRRYGLAEEIVHFKRRWFVRREDAETVLAQLLKRRRPVRVLDAARGSE